VTKWQGNHLALFFGFGLLVHLTPSSAEEIYRGLAGCAAIENTVNRLSYYDDLAKQRNVDKPMIETTSIGKWEVQSETSKIDDSTNALSVKSENEFAGRFRGASRAMFMITCREKSTHVYFTFGDHFIADHGGFGDMTIRIDKQKATTISAHESTDNGALGLWSGSGVQLLKKLFGKSTLLVRATPFNESAITVEFNIGEIEAAIAPIRKNCGW
jgi:type VI secretion system protein VasI